tara:strand:- start:332 stop:541 length:210 start_codon:yes stop_codon:yes gene_type:complete
MAKLLPKGTKGLAKLQNYNDVGEFVEKNKQKGKAVNKEERHVKNLAGGTANPLFQQEVTNEPNKSIQGE